MGRVEHCKYCKERVATLGELETVRYALEELKIMITHFD